MSPYLYKIILKKSFWDYMDNMLTAVLINIIYFALIAAEVSISLFFFEGRMKLILVVPIVGNLHILLFISHFIKDISDGKSCSLKDFRRYAKMGWLKGFLFGLVTLGILVILFFSVPFYVQLGGLLGALGAALITWFFLVLFFAAQYFFPVSSRFKDHFGKDIKKCFTLFLDNILLTLVLPFIIIIQVLFSMFTVFLLPGLSGILLWYDAAYWILNKKYEYLNGDPSSSKKKIPWKELLNSEEERIGQRSFFDTIFPFRKK